MVNAMIASGVLLLGVAGVAAAQAPPSAVPTSELKRLTVDQLMELEVTSVSKRGERLRDAAASVFVISADDIRRSGVTTLAEVLRLAPNLEVARIDSVQYAISARGFNNAVGNKLLVLIDGRTVYTPLFSGVFWDQQDVLLEDIERIEVVSGPGGTLWGANAVNGVINVITKSSAETQGTLIVGGIGNADGDLAVRWGGTVKSTAYRAYAKVNDWDNTQASNGRQVQNDWRRAQMGMRADWERGRDSLTIQADTYVGESEHRGFVGPIEVPPVEISGANALARWTRRLQSGSDVQLQMYFDHAKRNDFVLFRPEAKIVDIDFQQMLPWRGHRVLWGAGYRHGRDQVDNAVFSRFIPSSRRLNWQNVFAQGEFRLSERVAATLGTKLERNDYTGFEYLPSARIAWNASENHLVWGAVSRAVRAPSRFDREVFFPMDPPFLVVGGPNFQSEVANVFEMGFRGQSSTTMTYSIAGFSHVWDRLRSGTGLPVELENKIKGTVYGVEFWGTYQPLPYWTLNAGATVMSENLRLVDGSKDPVGVNNPTLRNDPDHYWLLRSSVDLARNIELDAHLRGVAKLRHPEVPGYTELGLRVGWRLHPRVQVSLSGQDLLHDSHPEFGAVSDGRSEIGRRVLGRAAWTF
jgi:iron complex outermembrane recepter protein